MVGMATSSPHARRSTMGVATHLRSMASTLLGAMPVRSSVGRCGVADAIPDHHRVRAELVQSRRPLPREKVEDAPATCRQGVGDQSPVAARRMHFRAHDRGALLGSQRLEPIDAALEFGRPHVVGVGAKGGASPGAVVDAVPGAAAAIAAPPPTQRSAEPDVSHVRRGEGGLEGYDAEVRAPLGARIASHVCDRADETAAQQRKELGHGVRRVADGEDDARSTRRHFRDAPSQVPPSSRRRSACAATTPGGASCPAGARCRRRLRRQ